MARQCLRVDNVAIRAGIHEFPRRLQECGENLTYKLPAAEQGKNCSDVTAASVASLSLSGCARWHCSKPTNGRTGGLDTNVVFSALLGETFMAFIRTFGQQRCLKNHGFTFTADRDYPVKQ